MSLLTMGVAGILVQEKYHSEKYATFRANVFLATIIFSILPLFHSLVLSNGWDFLHPLLFDLLKMGACYLIGVFFFVSRVPESIFPGRFDRTCHSHCIWHLWIIVAALAHYNVEYNIYHRFRPNGVALTCQQFQDMLTDPQ
jgi:adiponectin receptor